MFINFLSFSGDAVCEFFTRFFDNGSSDASLALRLPSVSVS